MTSLSMSRPGRLVFSPDPGSSANSSGYQKNSLSIYWFLFSLSILSFLISPWLTSVPVLLISSEILSLVTCGLAWLFTRALFRDNRDMSVWPVALVTSLFAISLILYVARGYFELDHIAFAYLAHLQRVIGSAVLLLTLHEVADGKGCRSNGFRGFYALGYALILGVAFLVELNSFETIRPDMQRALALLSWIGATAALYSVQVNGTDVENAPHETLGRIDPILTARIRQTLEEEEVFLDPDLKVASLARRLNVPAYQVSRAITAGFDAKNFNHLVNIYRITAAKKRLSDSQDEASILVIALDCGFGSLAPFNRAFKAQTGLTPSAFRAASRTRQIVS